MPSFVTRTDAILRGVAAVALAVTMAACAGSVQEEEGGAGTGVLADGAPTHSPAVDPGAPAADEAGDAIFGRQSAMLRPQAEPDPTHDGRTIAVIVPLSGRHAGAGRAILEGAQMALFDIGNANAVLLPLDSAGDPNRAAAAAQRAVDNGAGLIVGPLLAGSVEAVRPIAEAAGIPVIAFSNSPDVAGPPIYLAGFTPAAQVARMVENAVAEGRTRIAVLAPSTSYGDAVVSAAQRVLGEYRSGLRRPPPDIAAAIAGPDPGADESAPSSPESAPDTDSDTVAALIPELGPDDELRPAPVRLAQVVYYDPDAADHSAVIKRLADYDARNARLKREIAKLEERLAANAEDELAKRALERLGTLDTLGDPAFDAVLLPALTAQDAKTLAAQLAFYDVDEPAVRLLGLQPWDGFGDLSNEPTLIGARYVAPPDDFRARFAARFADIYGDRPSRLASLGYDVMAVAASLAATDDRPADFTAEAITLPGGFLGAEGLFRFTEDGLSDRGLAVREITPQGPRTVEPAPRSFPTPPPTVETDRGLSDQPEADGPPSS